MFRIIFFDDEINNEARYRILNQFETILDSRSDIRNVGIISKSGRMLINHGKKSVNSDLDLNTQEWYTQALDSPEDPKLTSSHVQHIISGERPWVITLSRGIRDREGSGEKEGLLYRSELQCDQWTCAIRVQWEPRDMHLSWMRRGILSIIHSSSSSTMNCRQRTSI